MLEQEQIATERNWEQAQLTWEQTQVFWKQEAVWVVSISNSCLQLSLCKECNQVNDDAS
jgi:hypothetical protein